MQQLAFAMAILHPASVILGVVRGEAWFLSTIVLSVVIYPIIEVVWACIQKIQSMQIHASEDSTWIAESTAYIVAATNLGLVVWLVCLGYKELNGYSFAAVCYSIGLCSGTNGITLAHEMMHRSSRLARWLSWALLFATSYPWFRLQHLRRHHLLVGTSADPATAGYGQNVYSFYVQSIGRGMVDIFKSEATQSIRSGRSAWNPLGNLALLSLLALAALYSAVWLVFGTWSLVALCLQGLVGILVLETINYIQHYGLVRQSTSSAVSSRLSWDTNSITNYALFNLGLHSEHHCRPGKRFSALRSAPGSPKMPFGYFVMALVAMYPPLWRKIMDHRINKSFGIGNC